MHDLASLGLREPRIEKRHPLSRLVDVSVCLSGSRYSCFVLAIVNHFTLEGNMKMITDHLGPPNICAA